MSNQLLKSLSLYAANSEDEIEDIINNHAGTGCAITITKQIAIGGVTVPSYTIFNFPVIANGTSIYGLGFNTTTQKFYVLVRTSSKEHLIFEK